MQNVVKWKTIGEVLLILLCLRAGCHRSVGSPIFFQGLEKCCTLFLPVGMEMYNLQLTEIDGHCIYTARFSTSYLLLFISILLIRLPMSSSACLTFSNTSSLSASRALCCWLTPCSTRSCSYNTQWKKKKCILLLPLNYDWEARNLPWRAKIFVDRKPTVSTKLESTEEYKRFFQHFKTCGCTSLCHGVWTVFVFQLFTRFVLWWKSDNLVQTLSCSKH